MRLSHSDLIPLLVIMGGGAVGVATSAALVLSLISALVSAPVPAVAATAPAAAPSVREDAAPVRVVFTVGADVSEPASHAGPAWPAPAPVRLMWTSDGGKIVVLCGENEADRPGTARGTDEWVLKSLRGSGESLEQVRSSLQQFGYNPGIANRYFDLMEAERAC
jgi:hypothetical protein